MHATSTETMLHGPKTEIKLIPFVLISLVSFTFSESAVSHIFVQSSKSNENSIPHPYTPKPLPSEMYIFIQKKTKAVKAVNTTQNSTKSWLANESETITRK